MKQVHKSLGAPRLLSVLVLSLLVTPIAAERYDTPPQRVPPEQTTNLDSAGGWQAVSERVNTGQLFEAAGLLRLPDVSEEEEPGSPTAPVDKPFGTITTDIRPSAGNLPADDDALAKFSRGGEMWHGTGFARAWPDNEFHWEASGLYHRPLYFEDTNLERHGYEVCYAQPLVSVTRFYCTVPALPYLMTLDSPHECVHTLGDGRPGSCVPFQVAKYPLRPGPAAIQALVITGLVFAIP